MADSTLPTDARGWHARVWQLTWPVILANVTIPLVGVADVAVMGRLPDPAYIGAVAMGAAMFSAVYWLFGFLRMATTGLAAQAYGRAELSNVTRTFARACCIGAALGLAIVALQRPLEWLLFLLFDASETVSALATEYYRIRIFGAPALLVHLAQLGVLFGLQRMRETLYLSVGMNITNLSLDVLFVLGFGWGVEGVAIGTVVSEWAAMGLGFWLIYRALKDLGWRPQRPDGLWQRAGVAELFHVSGNLVIRTFFVQLPFFMGTVLATGLGDLTLAAHGILMQLFFIMTYSLDGFAHTAETLTGYCYGAKRPHELRTAAIYSAVWGLGFGALTGAIYILIGDAFIAGFTQSAEVRATASAYLPWIALAPLVCVWAFLFDGIFIGTTHIVEMRNAMFASAAVWAALLAVLWHGQAIAPYHAVWLSMIVFMAVRGVLLWAYYPRIERAAHAG